MTALIDIECSSADSETPVEKNLEVYLEPDYVNHYLDLDIHGASPCSAPSLGWPLVDVKEGHTRILACLNPTNTHWITVEVVLDTSPPRIRYYNYLPSAARKGRTLAAIYKVSAADPISCKLQKGLCNPQFRSR
ncbi:hypothetical protein J1614_011067 [Plenodomus biglobosus]|nr:hypothetical protein J1614_011067 [Plenodomus biglobosus]